MRAPSPGQSDPGRNRQALAGWGRTAPSVAELRRPADLGELRRLVRAGPGRGVVARGLGRSYGDAAQNAGGLVLDMTGLDRILGLDVERRRARVQAGLSLDALMRAVLPLGLWPLVTPGTRQVTVGGAVASDVHGKNHHADGSFAAGVHSLVVETPGLGTVVTGATVEPELHWATVGGMGLTGVVVEAELDLLAVETAAVVVDTRPLPDLDALLSSMLEADVSHRYSVAWVDALARGGRLGRSLLELADHARRADLPGGRANGRARFDLDLSPRRAGGPSGGQFRGAAAGPRGGLPRPARLAVPAGVPSSVLNATTAAAFNELWYRRGARHGGERMVGLGTYFHPLDAVADWNRLYGAKGLVQYQFVVPDGAEAVVRLALETFATERCASFLSVLKRFGPANPAPLSFPRPGWTLALDLPARAPGLGRLLDGLDDAVAAAGGRVYLSKDSRLRPDLLEAMYPGLPGWRETRDRADPDRRLCSDLARRLPLLEAARHSGPTASGSGPSARYFGPTASGSGPSARHSGPTASGSGPSARHSGPTASGCGPSAPPRVPA